MAGNEGTAEPGLQCPFPLRVNPHAEQARLHVTRWVRHTGLIRRESAGRRFGRADFGWFAAAVYPTADVSCLCLMADWFAWFFQVDDQLDDGSFGRSPVRVGEAVTRMRAVLDCDGQSATADPDAPAAISALADLWRRTASRATPEWRRRFVGHLTECLRTAAVWEAGNRVSGAVPSEEAYFAHRRHIGAIYVCMDLIEIVEQVWVPAVVHGGPEFTAALEAASNVVCWTNDIYSLAKERSRGEVHNLVFLVQHHRGLDRRSALDHVRDAIAGETDRFLASEAKLLAAHPDRTAELLPCLAGMRTWMRGNLDWCRRTQRYDLTAADEVRPEEYLEAGLMEVDR